MFKHITNILILLLPFSIFAQDIKVSSKIDSIAIVIGDQTYLKLSVEQSKNDNVKFPVIKEKIIDGVEVVSVENIDTQQVNGGLAVSQKILITAFDDSIFTIPPFEFVSKGDTFYTKPLVLSVQYPIMDSTELAKIDTSQVIDIFDIEKPINTPFTFKEFWARFSWIIYSIIALILVTVIAILVIKRLKDKKPIVAKPPKPKEPAHIIALRALDQLKSKKLWQAGKEKLYYTQLTQILKDYIENRYEVSTDELTSMELMEMINQRQLFDNENVNNLLHILSVSDLAKFAKLKPLPDENDLCMDYAYKIVEQTKLEQAKLEQVEEITQNDEKSLANQQN